MFLSLISKEQKVQVCDATDDAILIFSPAHTKISTKKPLTFARGLYQTPHKAMATLKGNIHRHAAIRC
jgi:hypothetical protein